MKKEPRVFAIILNHNNGRLLKNCLAGVFKNDYPGLEAVVVDNGSDDGSFEFAKANFSKAVFIKNEANLGLAAGFNLGIRYALERMADYILLLRGNVEGDKDFIKKLVEAAEKEKAGIASPIIFKNGGKEVFFAGGRISWREAKYVYLQEIRTEDYFETEFVISSALLARADVFQKAGLLNEMYFMGGEDVDFSLRAQKAGLKSIVVPGSWAYCFEKTNNIENKIYWEAMARLIFFNKNVPGWAKPIVWVRLFMERAGLFLNSASGEAQAKKKAYKDFRDAKL